MKPYSHIRYLYLRDSKKNPHSCVVVQLDREDNVINYQVSTLSSKEGHYRNVYGDFVRTPFVKMKARYIACQRLTKRPYQIRTNLNGLSGHEITRLIMEDIISQKDHYTPDSTSLVKSELTWDDLNFVRGIPQRVRTSAKKWLKLHVEDRPTIPLMVAALSEVTDGNDEEVVELLESRSGDTLPPAFAEAFASDEDWDSIPIPPVKVLEPETPTCAVG